MTKTQAVLCLCLAAGVIFAAGAARSDNFWGAASAPWGEAGPVLYQLDTVMGTVGTTYAYNDWSWIMAATCAPDNTIYAIHNQTNDLYNFKLAKINAATGAVISDTLVKNLTGTDYPQWNALEYHNGKLYAVENCSFGSGYTAGVLRGYCYEVGLDANGDPTSATLGSYIGGYPAPDGALAYRDGVWYASDWRTDHSSWIKKTTDIMGVNFTADSSTSPVGLFDGWDFEADGDLLGVSWYYDFNVYKINTTSGACTALYNIRSQLPAQIESLSALSAAVPEPSSLAAMVVGILSMLGLRRRRA